MKSLFFASLMFMAQFALQFALGTIYPSPAKADELSRYYVVTASFGQVNRSGPIFPAPESRGDAIELSHLLQVQPDGSGTKRVGINWNGGVHGLSCTQTGLCSLEVVLPSSMFDTNSNHLTIRGHVAEQVYSALSTVAPLRIRGENARKSASNLVCSEVEGEPGRPGPRVNILCRVRDVSFGGTPQTLRQIVQVGFLTEAAALNILRDARVR